MIPTLIRRAAQQAPIPKVYTSPYQAKRLWPPDFSKLSKKEQFRFERRYRRRVKLKWARPKWTKAVKLVQLSSIAFVLVYGVFFMEGTDENHQPFQGIRNQAKEIVEMIWSTPPESLRRREEPDNASSRTSPKT